jgi:GNAT superfamily N-acetyltransferase
LSERESLTVVLSEVRLPRPVVLPYPRQRDDLGARLERGDCFLVADEEGAVGFLTLSLDRGAGVARVDDLLVDPQCRRRGIGTALVRAAVAAAREAGMRVVTLPCQAKNGAGHAFCRRLGLELCGYDEQHYLDHDVTLLFAYRTR